MNPIWYTKYIHRDRNINAAKRVQDNSYNNSFRVIFLTDQMDDAERIGAENEWNEREKKEQ